MVIPAFAGAFRRFATAIAPEKLKNLSAFERHL
jgi:hypothetical protein